MYMEMCKNRLKIVVFFTAIAVLIGYFSYANESSTVNTYSVDEQAYFSDIAQAN